MSAHTPQKHMTTGGCELMVWNPEPSEHSMYYDPSLGAGGRLLRLLMPQADDRREAIVYLDPESVEWLAKQVEQVPTMTTRRNPGNVRGRVWKVGDTWHYAVYIGDDAYLVDNTGSWRSVYDACLDDARALVRILIAGHELKQTWPQILSGDEEGTP